MGAIIMLRIIYILIYIIGWIDGEITHHASQQQNTMK